MSSAYYTIHNPGRKHCKIAEGEAESLEIAQRMANSTRRASTIQYMSREHRQRLWRIVKPEPRKGAVATRINARIEELIASGLTVEQAIATISAENTARLFAR